MNASKVARGLRDRIGRFSGDVSEGLGVVAQRFVAEMIYGIQASESVLLTEAAVPLRSLSRLRKPRSACRETCSALSWKRWCRTM